MLTRDDRTVTDCLEVLDTIEDLGITHIGFKDVGVDPAPSPSSTAASRTWAPPPTSKS